MTQEEILAQNKKEFAKLKRSATLLGIKYDEATTQEQLTALVLDAKAKVKLEELQEQADSLGIEYPEDATVEQIESLLAEDKAKKDKSAEVAKDLEAARTAAASLNVLVTDDMTAEQILAAIDLAQHPAELPLDAHTYYVWKDGNFVKYFINADYNGEGLKNAKQFAEEIGGTILI